MKILYINVGNSGSTGFIIDEISKEVKENGGSSCLCAAQIKDVKLENVDVVNVINKYEYRFVYNLNKIVGNQFGISKLATMRIKRVIKNFNPDIVHFHSANMFCADLYSIFDFLKKRNIPTVITNHAEFFYTGNCSYAYDCNKWKTGCGNCPIVREATKSYLDTTHRCWEKMYKALHNYKNCVMTSVSPWVDDRAKESPIVNEIPQTVVLDGINTEIFHSKDNTLKVKESFNLPTDKKIILHVTALFSTAENDIKGGRYVLELAKRNPDLFFVITGPAPKIDNCPDNVLFTGEILNKDTLSDLYNMADLTLLVSKRETFSMVLAESLCCGTPVVAFKAGGPESIAINEFCNFADYGDVDKINDLIISDINKKDLIGKEAISKASTEKYDSAVMAKEFYAIYKAMLQN